MNMGNVTGDIYIFLLLTEFITSVSSCTYPTIIANSRIKLFKCWVLMLGDKLESYFIISNLKSWQLDMILAKFWNTLLCSPKWGSK